MATIQKTIITTASPDAAWSALRDIGALHTRLVPGFVTDTRLEPGARVVTFANGMVAREPIISVNEELRRVAWTAENEKLKHYNSAAQVFPSEGGSRITWTSDLLPDEAASFVEQMMEQGMKAMKTALDRLGSR